MSERKEIAEIKKETKNIMNQIMDINDHVSDSFYLIEAVATQKAGIWDKISGKNTTDKITNLASAMGSTNVAVMQLSQVVQKAMALSCRSMVHAQTMTKTIGKMLEKGLEDTHGEIRQLSGQDREIAEQILRSAQTFTENQEAIEAEFSNTSKKVEGLEVDINSLKEESNKFVRQDVFGELHDVVSQQQRSLEESKATYSGRFDELEKEMGRKTKELKTELTSSFKEESADFVRQGSFSELHEVVSQQQRNLEESKATYSSRIDELEKEMGRKMEELKTELTSSFKEESAGFIRQSDLDSIYKQDIARYQDLASEEISKFTLQQIEAARDSMTSSCNSLKSDLESIVADAGKALRQETEHLLLQQKAELEELKSQLQANKKTPPLAIAALAVAIAAVLGVVVAFCTLKPNTEAPVSAPTAAAELQPTTTAPTN
ncbi:MAG: hypothetical protein IJW57_04260 [Spirochaetaceae bacterium]|nr:hypothetical protein [Spirochaetaceae bacterium]